METLTLFGDPVKNPALTEDKKGKNQTLFGTDNNSMNIIFGDVRFMFDFSKGGNDTLQGGNNNKEVLINSLIGDAAQMFDSAKGGNDTLQGGDNSGFMLVNGLAGDAALMFDSAKGGNDTLQGGNNSSGILVNGLAGDAAAMLDSTKGGNDTLHGGNNTNGMLTTVLVGDAIAILNDSHGGNDTLSGSNNQGTGIVKNHLFGDARYINDSDQLGNDRLISGSNATDHMYGDAQNIILGNNDILDEIFDNIENLALNNNNLPADIDLFDPIGGLKSNFLNNLSQAVLGISDFDKGTSVSISNLISIVNELKNILNNNEYITLTNVTSGSADTFVFNDNFKDDYIHDFRQSDGDKIEFNISGVNSFDDLNIEYHENDTIISVANHGTVTLIGVSGVDLSGEISFLS